MPYASTPKRRVSFQRRLAAWFGKAGRDLPWRRTRDPYAVVVSEFMLQQTQVSRVLEYYDRFLHSYPDFARLAAARPRAVREAWDGLGYYRRAANLHRLARTVVKDHGGRLPDDPARLVELPGIGPYTAGAVACFAYERPAAAVDTNVARVLTRFFRPRRRTPRALRELAQQLVPRSAGGAAWKFGQALMELGALVCTARAPRCGQCPLRADCASLRASPRRSRARRGS